MPALSGSQKALMQARSGLARSGATRAAYFYPNTVVVINGTDRTYYVQDGSVQITKNYNGTPWTCRFTINPKAPFSPLPEQIVYIGLGTSVNREFGGQIVSVRHRRLKANQGSYVDVECVDFTRLLDARLVTERYTYDTADTIIRALVAKYAPLFTTTNVVTNLPTIPDFPITNERLSTVLVRLVQAIGGGGAYVDANRDIHLFNTVGETGGRAQTPPQPINNTAITIEAVSQHGQDASQKRTRAIVEGQRTKLLLGSPGDSTAIVGGATQAVDFLLVGGGGSGGTTRQGGGGGGRVIPGTDTLGAGSYSIVVGAGGVTSNGGDSTFNGHTAAGGGQGGLTGSTGGSGGGSSNTNPGGAASGTEGYGNAGGAGNFALSAAGGGGGGAGTAGSDAGPLTGGNGGNGYASSISGSSQTYGGGGGGNGDSSSGTGGTGGGGNGGAGGNPGTAGTANTGGGGGGGGSYNGGSGICIVSYPTGSLSATGGTITTVGDRTIHTFTSNGTFTISSVTVISISQTVTDLPVQDISQLDAAGGTVRIGQTVTSYVGLLGPTVKDGENPPGSTLSADAAAGATTLNLTSSAAFTSSPGWAKVGDQIVRFTGVGVNTLTGVPGAGFGSLALATKSGTQVTWLGAINLSASPVTFDPALQKDDDVVQRVVINDTASQTTLASADGISDGIRESLTQDGRLNVSGATTVGTGDLTAFKSDLFTAEWTTRDMNAQPGTSQVINRTGADAVSGTVILTRVDVTLRTRGFMKPPARRCVGSTVRLPTVIDVAITKKSSTT